MNTATDRRSICWLVVTCCLIPLLTRAEAQTAVSGQVLAPNASSLQVVHRADDVNGNQALRAVIPDFYGGWMMWWSTNREEFFSETNLPIAGSRPVYSESLRLVSAEECRTQIIPVLHRCLKDSEREVRDAASIALGLCGDERDVGPLIEVLGDRDRAVSEAAVMGLGLLRVPEASGVLGKTLSDTTMGERKRGLAALALGLSGVEAAGKPLLDGIGSGKSDKIEACRMVAAGLWCGADSSDAKQDRIALAASQIRKALTNQESKRRKLLSMGTAAFSKVRDPASLLFILEMLRDPRFDIRAAAAIAAGRMIRQGDKAHLQVLIDALVDEAHTLPTRFMIISLGRIGGPEAIKQLMKELGSGEKMRCSFGAFALGIAGASEAASRLRQMLSAPTDERMKSAFVIALGLLKDRQTFGTVTAAAQVKADNEFHAACMWFFALSQNPDARPILEKVVAESNVAETQEAAATALGLLGAVESVPVLTQLLLGKNTDATRKAAAIGLGRMRDHRALEALIKVANSDVSVTVRAAAVSALGEVARRSFRPPFSRIAIDAYYGLQNEAIDEMATRVGSLMRTTEEGGVNASGERCIGRSHRLPGAFCYPAPRCQHSITA